MGFVDFNAYPGANSTPGASDFDLMMRQGILRFDDSDDRDTQLSAVLAEGLVAQTLDDDTFWRYDGTDWEILLEPVQSWSPTLQQFGNVSATVEYGSYYRERGRFWAECRLTATAGGTSGNIIAVTTPFTVVTAHGTFSYWDASIGWDRVGAARLYDSTHLAFRIDQGTDWYGIASGDAITADDELTLSIQGTY